MHLSLKNQVFVCKSDLQRFLKSLSRSTFVYLFEITRERIRTHMYIVRSFSALMFAVNLLDVKRLVQCIARRCRYTIRTNLKHNHYHPGLYPQSTSGTVTAAHSGSRFPAMFPTHLTSRIPTSMGQASIRTNMTFKLALDAGVYENLRV
jgi:hypothetical protein